jgi:secondary thiamine-phosphate synthase enzyme
MTKLSIHTSRRTEAKEITREVARLVDKSDATLVHIFCSHTSCGLSINENADPAVMQDVMNALARMAPVDPAYAHREGNSDAHIKASLVGHSLTVPIAQGKLVLGVWQGIYLMEFDGPRERTIILSLMK